MQNRLMRPRSLLKGNILDQQTQYPLMLFGCRARSLPEPRQIFSQLPDLPLLVGRQRRGLLLPVFTVLLPDLCHLLKRLLPAFLKIVCHQPIGRIDFVEAPLG